MEGLGVKGLLEQSDPQNDRGTEGSKRAGHVPAHQGRTPHRTSVHQLKKPRDPAMPGSPPCVLSLHSPKGLVHRPQQEVCPSSRGPAHQASLEHRATEEPHRTRTPEAPNHLTAPPTRETGREGGREPETASWSQSPGARVQEANTPTYPRSTPHQAAQGVATNPGAGLTPTPEIPHTAGAQRGHHRPTWHTPPPPPPLKPRNPASPHTESKHAGPGRPHHSSSPSDSLSALPIGFSSTGCA